MPETIEALKDHREYLFTVIDGLVDDNEIYAQRNISLAQLRDNLKEENDTLRFKVDTNRVGIMVLDQRVESLEAENGKLREALEKADALAKIGEEAARLLNWDEFSEALRVYWEVRDAAC